MMEMEWTLLERKLGLKTRLELISKSLQLRYFINLPCLQVPGLSLSFFQSSSYNFPSYTTLCYDILPIDPSSSVDARSFTFSTIVYVARDSYVQMTFLPRVGNLVAGLGNTLNLMSHNCYMSIIDKNKMKSTHVTSIYFIKFPALHKSHQLVKIKPSQRNTLSKNRSNSSEIKLNIHDGTTIMTTFMTPPNLSSRLHLPDPNSHLIDTNNLNDPMTPIEIEEGDYLFIPDGNPTKNKFQIYTMYKRVDKKVRPVPAQFPEDCQIQRRIPEDPLLTLIPLNLNPPDFKPTKKITED